jgi:predicted porin
MRKLSTVGLVATAAMYISPAAAEEPIVEVYGTLLPFVESVGTSGATQVPNGLYTGINHERRVRMTAGTSHIGFRGEWGIAEDLLKLVWQVESPTPIDGEGPSNWANRNSHVGLAGTWGTFIYGNWDTPMRWATVTSVNPLKGGYTGDMTAIIGTPGHSIPAWNADQTLTAILDVPPNRAGFFRHEANSIQYWSPTLFGFSARLMYAVNEHRTAGIPGTEVPLNPYLLSGSIGYDNDWLRVRYSAEYHNDYFGTASMGGPNASLTNPNSQDIGHLGLVSVTINGKSKYKTRVVATGDYLGYHTADTTLSGNGGYINEYSRLAVYALVQQTLKNHNIWVAYGRTTEGKCNVTSPGFNCTTTGLSAAYYTLGYMYEFAKSTQIYALGYGLVNDVSARYTPFPLLDSRAASAASLPNIGEISPGSDSVGVGVGFVYTFGARISGKKEEAPKPEQAPAIVPEQKAPAPTEPSAAAAESTSLSATADGTVPSTEDGAAAGTFDTNPGEASRAAP